jgi:hypothetical protein
VGIRSKGHVLKQTSSPLQPPGRTASDITEYREAANYRSSDLTMAAPRYCGPQMGRSVLTSLNLHMATGAVTL